MRRTAARSTAGARRAERGVDPLKLCVFTTVALLGWLLGPWAVLVFATLAFTAYSKARRGGLLRSKCLLRDTRLVLAWLGLLVVVAVVAIAWDVAHCSEIPRPGRSAAVGATRPPRPVVVQFFARAAGPPAGERRGPPAPSRLVHGWTWDTRAARLRQALAPSAAALG